MKYIEFIRKDYPVVFVNVLDSETGEVINFNFEDYEKYLTSGNYIVENLKACWNYLVDFFKSRDFKIISDRSAKIKNSTFKVFISDTEKFFFNFKYKNQNVLIQNFETKFTRFDLDIVMKEKHFNRLQAMSYVYDKAFELGLAGGYTLASSIRKLYMSSKFHGAKEIRGFRFNTKRFTDFQNEVVENSLMGGRAFLNKQYKRKLLNNLEILDINSSYPYIAKTQKLPCGVPEEFDTEEEYNNNKMKYPLALFRICVSASIKENCLSFIGQKVDGIVSYPNKFEFAIVNIWSFELEEMRKFYDIKHFRILNIIAFKTCVGFFNGILDYFANLKETSVEYTTNKLAKMGLNNFLGKFGSKRKKVSEFYTEEGADSKLVISDDYYQPLFSCITAYGRINICSKINRFIGLDKLVYCDTDSLVFFYDKEINRLFKIDSKQFGAWKMIRLKEFIANKTKVYSYLTTDNVIKTVVAGVADTSDFSPKKLLEGWHVYLKQFDFSGIVPKEKIVKYKF